MMFKRRYIIVFASYQPSPSCYPYSNVIILYYRLVIIILSSTTYVKPRLEINSVRRTRYTLDVYSVFSFQEGSKSLPLDFAWLSMKSPGQPHTTSHQKLLAYATQMRIKSLSRIELQKDLKIHQKSYILFVIRQV